WRRGRWRRRRRALRVIASDLSAVARRAKAEAKQSSSSSTREERRLGCRLASRLAMTLRERQLFYPDRLLLVFCVRLPCAACSRMLCFSSSRWPLVVSMGTRGSLPAPLWLLLSSGTLMCFAVFGIQFLPCDIRRTIAARASFPARQIEASPVPADL